ncbi:MAG: MBOAT family protein [Clostridia bacterium]|nr:MBOAT family protein [Clostridia bacterium]
MVFSSIEFLFLYLPFALLIYFVIPAKFLVWRNVALLILSLLFYGWSEPLYIFIMFFSICVDYVCGYLVSKHQDSEPKKAKGALVASVVLNLSVLGFFKYFDFFVVNLSRIPIFSGLKPLGITLPVGISFYTFQTMSYTLDLYLRKAKVQKNIFSFGTYVTMFPQLIAGPIVRYCDVDEALRRREHNFERAARGIERFICGLSKKVLLANTAGVMYEQIVQTVESQPNVLSAWTALGFYAFQIYFDFSGYSDMAIGLGLILGFKFPENFNYPYISKNITEFWRRWHITLSTWFKEYVYIPLGGNRKTKFRTFFNLFVVWFLTGFWHGASWNFVLWGLYFCLLLIIEKAFLNKALDKLPKAISRIYFVFFILIGWFIFISCDLAEPMSFLKAMFTGPFISQTAIYDIIRSALFLPILIFASTPYPKKLYSRFWDKKGFGGVRLVLMIIAFIICVAYLVDSSYNPFLYFRF